jgi:FMN phosphatase YigB (HAD superfamily)
MSNNLVFLFDVDNTLLDNDSVTTDLRDHLEREVGHERQERYWEIFEELRTKLGYADYLGALQSYRTAYPCDLHVLTVSHFLLDYPFHKRLYPGVPEVVEYVKQFGTPVILTDGDVVFQPLKIRRSGLHEAFKGAVLVYVHKEFELKDVEQRYPANNYVLVDDKLRILTAVKKIWRDRVATVFPRQGHYALDQKIVHDFPAADYTIECIADLVKLDLRKISRTEG